MADYTFADGVPVSAPSDSVSDTKFCTRQDLEDIWSEAGVDYRTDDMTGAAVDNLIERTIQQATARVKFYVGERYDASLLKNSTFIQECTAVLAAYDLGIRRGNPSVAALKERHEEVKKDLASVKTADYDIPGLATRFSSAPCLSNLRWDGRYTQSKVRVQPQISTGGAPTNVEQKTQWDGYTERQP